VVLRGTTDHARHPDRHRDDDHRGGRDGMETVEIAIKGPEGEILPNAIPSVSIVKDGGYCGEEFGEDPALEPDLAFLVEHKLSLGRLAGRQSEGSLKKHGKIFKSLEHRAIAKIAKPTVETSG
jgi:hypothetical protein